MELERLEDGLSTLFAKLYHDKVKISNLEDITVGWETRIIAFTLTRPGGVSELVVRLFQGGGASHKSEREFNVMIRLSEAGYPVPKVYAHSAKSEALGNPFLVMERITGMTLWDDFFSGPRSRWGDVLAVNARLMAKLHATDPTKIFPPEPSCTTHSRIFSQLEDEAKIFERNNLEDEFAPLIRWLKNAITSVVESPLCVVHRDLHPRNILLRRDGSPVVIDWGACRLGDFREDLCWTGLLAGTFIDGILKDAFYDAYKKFSHRALENLDYFEAYAALRRLADAYISLRAGPEARGMRPEAVKQMEQNRLHYERVYRRLVEVTGIEIPQVKKLFEDR